MKNFSAPKLLRMALSGAHMSYCPHANDKTPGYECLCWKNEIRKWDARIKAASANRVRKPRATRVHLQNYKCSNKNPNVIFTTDVTQITCKQCLKHANTPPKAPRLPKTQKSSSRRKTNGLSSSNSLLATAP